MPSSSSTSRRATTASSWTTMPTKPSSQSSPSGERGQAGLGGDRDRHLVADDQAARAAELLLGEEERRHLAQRRAPASALRAARNGKRTSVSCQSASGIGASLERAGAPPALPPAGHGADDRAAVSGAMRTKPLALQRRISARGWLLPSSSQSLSTWRTAPGASSWLAGAWVWPWISVGVSARLHPGERGARHRRRCSHRARAARVGRCVA